jgi:hypothetical protein
MPFLAVHLEAARELSSQIPVVEGGPAGSGVFKATISAATEQLGGAALGNIWKKCLS